MSHGFGRKKGEALPMKRARMLRAVLLLLGVSLLFQLSNLAGEAERPELFAQSPALGVANEELKLSGQTDAEGGFFLALPWPGVFARGRLQSSNGALGHTSFHLVLRFRGSGPRTPEGIRSFRLEVPRFIPQDIERFTVLISGSQTHFLLGEIAVEEAELHWDPARPLRWEDFRGEPPPGANREGAQIHLALSWTGEWEVRFDRGRGLWAAQLVSVATFNTMDRAQSWVLPHAKTAEVLNHEQKHFDLNEVYRRLLDLSLRRLVGGEWTGRTREEAEGKLRAHLNAVFQSVSRKCQEIQDQYDRETDYGRNLQKQREWDRIISEWLLDPLRAPQP